MHVLKNAYYVLLGNLDYFGILLLIFIAVVGLCLGLILLLGRRQSAEASRLSKLVRPGKSTVDSQQKPKLLDREQEGLAARISRPLHKSIDERSTRQKLRLKLIQAGYRSDYAAYNYLAAKIVLPLLLVGIYLATRFFYKLDANILGYVLLLGLMGFFLPTVWVFLMGLARKELIFKGLPDALDLMVVCVESGLGLDMTFKRVGEEIRPMCKDLSDEFEQTNLEIRAGVPRDDAFRAMALRTGVSEVSILMTVLTQTSRFGTSLAKALRVHADAMRIKRRQIAEETAAKSTVKLIFPLVLFIFPAIFVVLIGPGAIKIVQVLFPALGG
ncbi:MAG: type II secretion system F family protein [Desulfuromonadales bacterium]|nr:type II secretion system F family protein [Desulfuromonadales bacterium]